MAFSTATFTNRAKHTLAGYSPGQRAVVVIAIAALVVGGVIFSQWITKPNMVPLYSNLASSDASAITGKLSAANVPYELSNGGNTILVPRDRVYQTRLDMAAENLPSGGNAGYSLLDKKGITTSDFMEQVNYQRAVEGELTKTIGAIDLVETASVHLVMPKTDVFASDSKKASASVLVKTRGAKQLSNSQVQAITNLVASSVQGLSAEEVTVADDKGRILAAPGQSPQQADDQQNQATRTLEDNLNAKINTMLSRIVGEGNSYVQARAELNFDRSKITEEQWNPDARQPDVKSQQTETETYTNGANGDGQTGCLGTGTPVNGVCIPGQTDPNNPNTGAYLNQKTTQDFNNDRRLTQTEAATGTPRRITVAVVLNSNAANVDPNEVTNLVTQAAGLQAARGDAVTVSRMPFDTATATQAEKDLKAAEKAEQQKQILDIAKAAATIIVVALVLGLMYLATKKRAANYSATPISLAELDAAMTPLPAYEPMDAISASAPAHIELDIPNAEALEREKIDREISGLIEKQPEEVAQLLRSWLADRRG